MSTVENRKNIFAMFDTDGSGSINTSELQKAFEQLCGEEIKCDEIKQIISEFDKDGNQKLDFEEFCALADQLDAMAN